MDSTGLKTLSIITPFSFSLRFRNPLFRPLFIAHSRRKLHLYLSYNNRFAPLCSLSDRVDGTSLQHGVGDTVEEVSRKKLLQVVLVSPQPHLVEAGSEISGHCQIPGNTGCIARTCAASAIGLHLVEPLGFQVDDTKLKRAGLDYWPYVVVKVHRSWAEFREYFLHQDGDNRLLAFTKRGMTIHSDFTYKGGDWLVFGSETRGLPPEVLLDCKVEAYGGGTIRIPMVDTYVRCLNLSVSVGIAVYEASRQLNYKQLEFSPKTCIDNGSSCIMEDIFA